MAELYSRLSRVEDRTNILEEATTRRFRDLHQDIDRLHSNSETQKKYIGQEVMRLETQSQSAAERTQAQIDSLRQQTSDMHTSLSSIHEHSGLLTQGLQNMMDRFQDLRFDLPHAFDDWLRVREERGSGTVSGAELQPRFSGRNTPLPSLPTLGPLVVSPPPPPPSQTPAFPRGTPEGSSAAPESPSRPATLNSSGAPSSPADAFRFMGSSLQDDNEAILDLNLDAGDENAMNVDTEEMRMEGMQSTEQDAGPRDVEADTTAPTTASIGREASISGVQGEGVLEMEGEGVGRQEDDGAPAPAAVVAPKMESRDGSLQPPSIPEVQVGPQPAAEGHTLPHLSTPSRGTPPSTPPTFIRDVSVPPPSGLLVSESILVLPPSSQSLPSPSPRPDFRLLNAPPSRAPSQAPATGFTGRMTQSRSRSITNPPQEPSAPGTTSKKNGTRHASGSQR